MRTQNIEQIYSFFVFALVGFLIGLLFDLFRISRKTFKTSDLITSIEDIIFWMLSGMLVLFSIYKFNNGDLRLYIIIGIIAGVVFYVLIFSKIVINVLFSFIMIIKKVFIYIFKIIFLPIKKIKNIIIIIIYKNKLKNKKDFV